MTSLSSKAATLEELSGSLRTAKILPLVRFTVGDWDKNPPAILSRIEKVLGSTGPFIVRSSARNEDTSESSMAGRYLSVPNVTGNVVLREAIEKVITSYGARTLLDEVFVQPYLSKVAMAGVAFTRDPNGGGDYFVINYDESGATDLVTSGRSNQLNTYYHYKHHKGFPPLSLGRVVDLLRELEGAIHHESLDVEFAVDNQGELNILQVRPLAARKQAVPAALHTRTLEEIERKIDEISGPHPYVHGTRAIYGIMPDWNPAEIIGVRPRPLALSLYKELITDNIWAYQRDGYGYKNLRSFPLLLSFGGLPYIDVRVSFNSFVPSTVEPYLSEKLVNYYISSLIAAPTAHDKVEFEVVFSCYTPDLPLRMEPLREKGFTPGELADLSDKLRTLTNKIINGDSGLWKRDREKISVLESRHALIMKSGLSPLSKLYWLLEDCKRYGTLPFAGLARAAFIAVQLLRSLRNVGVLGQENYEAFMASLNTVSSQMAEDFHRLSKGDFLSRYGHLRPGTYDILSPRYDEAPDRYFDWAKRDPKRSSEKLEFRLSLPQLHAIEKILKEHKLEHDVLGLFEFLKSAIEGRELAKFVFSRSLSDGIKLFSEMGRRAGLSPEDCAFASIDVVRQLYGTSDGLTQTLSSSVREGKERYAVTQQLVLPPLVVESKSVWQFMLSGSDPNFITTKQATGHVAFPGDAKDKLKASILLIPSADPGFDWIFSHQLAGFITMYGGLNSHMAIRAAELGVPAVIGAGQIHFEQWKKAHLLEIDALNRQVRVLK